jgi:phosphoenolpyruvate carboxykinase (GTP)
VPISAFLFGGRRPSVVPLVHQARSWQHGTFLGSIVSSEKTAAADGKVGELRRDPFAMLPFCGYHMGDYFSYWLSIGKRTNPEKLPKIFYVNWFRKDSQGRWLWPGYSENCRVLKWVFERCNNVDNADETPIGFVPTLKAIDRQGLDLPDEDMAELLRIDRRGWLEEVDSIKEHYKKFGDKLPAALKKELNDLENRLQVSP